MKVELYQDGKLKWTIEAVGPAIGEGDIAILPKSVAKGCSLSADSFDEIFYACMSGSRTNGEAYEKAEQVHLQYFEKRKYSDYQSYKSYKSQRMKK